MAPLMQHADVVVAVPQSKEGYVAKKEAPKSSGKKSSWGSLRFLRKKSHHRDSSQRRLTAELSTLHESSLLHDIDPKISPTSAKQQIHLASLNAKSLFLDIDRTSATERMHSSSTSCDFTSYADKVIHVRRKDDEAEESEGQLEETRELCETGCLRIRTQTESSSISYYRSKLKRSTTLGDSTVSDDSETSEAKNGSDDDVADKMTNLFCLLGSDSGTTDETYQHRRVRFSTIELHSFERILGDNPSVSSGPPVALGNALVSKDTFTVDEYESSHPPLRKKADMLLMKMDREDILKEYGYSRADFVDVDRALHKIKQSRALNAHQSQAEKVWEGVVEAVRQYLRRRKQRRKKVEQL